MAENKADGDDNIAITDIEKSHVQVNKDNKTEQQAQQIFNYHGPVTHNQLDVKALAAELYELQQQKDGEQKATIASLKQQLNQNEEIIAQQKKTREELEASLAAEKEKLKKQALIAVEEKDYNKAEVLLMESAADSMKQTAETFY